MQVTSLHHTSYKADFQLNFSVGSTTSFSPIVLQCFLEEKKNLIANKHVTNQSLTNHRIESK